MNFWKAKLAAFLHDPPSKCLDIQRHGERSDQAFRQAGFTDEVEIGEYFKHADHTGAAADRFPFPLSRSASLACAFDGVRNSFRHPLCGEDQIPFWSEFASVELGIEGEQSVQPGLDDKSLSDLNVTEHWRARFFAHWRLWPDFAREKDYRLGFLPADTRIPDHTIWTHMQVVSALAGCVGPDKTWKPAFLKFQLGPVQEFIAAARSTRDLWSSSYLLSWLMAAGLKALSESEGGGPDSVIFPNLRDQPIFDLQWRDELWSKIKIGNEAVWESMRKQASARDRQSAANNSEMDLLTPNLPNVFLAVVNAERAPALARSVGEAIRVEWKGISNSVWEKVARSGLLELLPPHLSPEEAKSRFEAQRDRFLSISWQVSPWPETVADARALAAQMPAENPEPGEKSLLQRFDAIIRAAAEAMPFNHRDPRYYVGGEKGARDSLNNVGIGWALMTATNGWALDAVRQTRDFQAWSAAGWQNAGVAQSKDALTGREEMIFGGRGFAESVKELLPDSEWSKLFKHDDEIGGITLIKRLWHWTWLHEHWGLKAKRGQFPMPDTRNLAEHQPFEDNAETNLDESRDEESKGKYFAVLALDGDSIGKWVSGEKTPFYRTQFADYHDGTRQQQQGAIEYFTRNSNPDGHSEGTLEKRFADLLDTRRLVSPSYHLQFSESLSNFALRCARRIVEAYHGRLIYAGGDDVLAMLPADTALSCAQALRKAFRGSHTFGPDQARIFHSPAPGFLTTDDWKDDYGGRPIPFIVPGPKADCSVGIAIAHFKAPLQDVVRAAQAAEKRAKKKLERSAVAVTLCKRSGETVEWGCKWDDGGLEIHSRMLAALESGAVSAKFPHRVAELVQPYITPSGPSRRVAELVEGFDPVAVSLNEFRHAWERQGSKEKAEFSTLAELAKVADDSDRVNLRKYLERAQQQAVPAILKNLKEYCEVHQGSFDTAYFVGQIDRLLGETTGPKQLESSLKLLDELQGSEMGDLVKRTKARIRRWKVGLVLVPLEALVGLCQTVAFAARTQPNEATNTRKQPLGPAMKEATA